MRRRSKALDPAALPAPPPVIEGVFWGSRSTQRAVRCWWPGALPAASLVKIEGRKSTGKSTIAAAIAASVAGGPLIPGWTGPRNRRVLWISGEEDWESVVVPRLVQAGLPDGSYGHLMIPSKVNDWRRPVLPDDLMILQDTLCEGNVGVLVLDPFSSLCHSSINLNLPQEARRYLELIASTIAVTDTLCVCIGHVKKGRGGDSREAGYFSAEVTNVMRSVLRCDEHPTERSRRVLSVVAYNYGATLPTQLFRLVGEEGSLARVEWDGVCDLDADTICEGRGDEAMRDEWSDAECLLYHAIGSGWVHVRDIQAEAMEAGIGWGIVRRAKTRLGVDKRRTAFGAAGHWEWGPPKAGWPAGLASAQGDSPPQTEAPPEEPKKAKRAKRPRRKRTPSPREGVSENPIDTIATLDILEGGTNGQSPSD